MATACAMVNFSSTVMILPLVRMRSDRRLLRADAAPASISRPTVPPARIRLHSVIATSPPGPPRPATSCSAEPGLRRGAGPRCEPAPPRRGPAEVGRKLTRATDRGQRARRLREKMVGSVLRRNGWRRGIRWRIRGRRQVVCRNVRNHERHRQRRRRRTFDGRRDHGLGEENQRLHEAEAGPCDDGEQQHGDLEPPQPHAAASPCASAERSCGCDAPPPTAV